MSDRPVAPATDDGDDGDDDGPFVADTGVTEALDGERLDRALALLHGWSRAEVRALVDAGLVLVDGRTVPRSHRLRAGERVEVRGAPPGAVALGAEPVPLDVRYEDEHLAVVDKPAGLVVHPGAGHEHGTLAHGLLARYPEVAGVGAPDRPGIVHRLDRDTSGLLVVARTEVAYEGLVAMLQAHAIDRRYLALVWGRPDAPRGMIDAPIGRSTARRTRMAVRAEGKEARTEYEVVEALDRVALLACRLETGRTHQIRVHLAAIGHPVVGDATYGGARPGLPGGPLERPFLHAVRLAFAHPVTGAPVDVESPLPAALQAVLDASRRLASG